MPVKRKRNLALLLLLLIAWHPRSIAYSLLTHEELIDLTWQDSIVPLLLSSYPGLTSAQLDRARAYAYGGCVIQDMGYYPFGDQLFSDLTHYVRTGDFVLALFRNAKNADELAFAIGALSHYIGDSIGHSQATNHAVALQFPKLRARYGPSVNYAQGKHPHVQVEFAFDIDQITQHRLAPIQYLRHIGMSVPIRQLTLAFYQTYGINENFTRHGRTFNIDTYRMATRKLIPRAAYALTLIHRDQEPPEPDNDDTKQITIEAANASKLSGWDAYRRKAGFETHFIAFLIRIAPKFGPLALLAIKGPTTTAEADYLHSLVSSTSIIRNRLTLLTPIANRVAPPAGVTIAAMPAMAEDPRRPFINRDLDTGQSVKPGGYSLTDKTYAKLLARLTEDPKQSIPPGIKQDILAYYSDPNAPIITKKDPRAWSAVQDQLKVLASMPTSNEPAPYPTYGESPSHPDKSESTQ